MNPPSGGSLAPDADWHRQQAKAAFNRAWDLIDMPNRTRRDEDEMLRCAFASRHHWEMVGGVEKQAVGDWQVAHVASLLGLADLALRFARSGLDAAEAHGWVGWRLASAREGMARALATRGDREGRDRYVALAREALEGEPNPEEREIIESQLNTIP